MRVAHVNISNVPANFVPANFVRSYFDAKFEINSCLDAVLRTGNGCKQTNKNLTNN